MRRWGALIGPRDAAAMPRKFGPSNRGTCVAKSLSVEDRTVTKLISERRAHAMSQVVVGLPWPRIGNLLLGVWLQISAFAWLHTDAARMSAWLPGLLISVVAVLAMGAPPLRWLNAFMSFWLLLWTLFETGSEPRGYWNGVACALLVLILSTIPSRSAATDFRE